jgi:hypothetical protein
VVIIESWNDIYLHIKEGMTTMQGEEANNCGRILNCDWMKIIIVN